ncbi:hypothetical protein [Bartonella pachyuromydis]|uniref:Uncharacterized protein n=1 Tax=Bartonella pachyuromydis TaxID=931097 RepID=A0ABP8VJG1_9HYPH
MMRENSHFDQAVQNSMNHVRDTINSSFSGAGRYESGAYKKILERELNALSTNAMANHFHQNVQHMNQANAHLNRLRQNRLRMTEDLLKGYEKALSDAAQATTILEADNQQRVNTAHKQ